MRGWIAAGLLCVSFAVASQPPTPTPVEHGQDKQEQPSQAARGPKSDQNPTDTPPPSNQRLAPAEQQLEHNHGGEGAHEAPWEKYVEPISIALTAIATIVLAVFTFFLAKTTRRLWIEAQAASKIAKITADAANTSANVAKETLIQSNRPWVCIDSVDIGGMRMNGEMVESHFSIKLRNVGRSPALGIEHFAIITTDWMVLPDDVPSRIDVALGGRKKEWMHPSQALFPGESKTYELISGRGGLPADFRVDGVYCVICGAAYRFAFGDKESRYVAQVIQIGGESPLILSSITD